MACNMTDLCNNYFYVESLSPCPASLSPLGCLLQENMSKYLSSFSSSFFLLVWPSITLPLSVCCSELAVLLLPAKAKCSIELEKDSAIVMDFYRDVLIWKTLRLDFSFSEVLMCHFNSVEDTVF